MPGTLFVVATPIGNLEDITARALRVLSEVHLIAAEDTRRTGQLLAKFAIRTPTTSVHQHNEAKKIAGILDRLQRGENVALVSDAGTPTISDPGQRLVRAAVDAGIRTEPIPGPSAAVAVLAVSGFEGSTFTFLGFPPIRSKDRKLWFEQLATAGRPVVFFEAPHRIVETLKQVMVRLGDRPVVVGRELSKTHEELVRGPISMVLKRLTNPIGEFTIAIDIGHMTDLGHPASVADADILHEFSHLTKSGRLTRRMAVRELARKHGLAPNRVYQAIEDGKKSVI
jgi:16S rRNA (cytidine1402-2'-O)-methyltransferase